MAFGSLEILRSNPRVVLFKRLVWLVVSGLFLWAVSGVVWQFRGLIVSDRYAVNLLIVGDGRVGLLHFDPMNRRLYKLRVPEALEVEASGEQRVELSRLWSYAASKGDPFEYLKGPLSGFLGIPIDGYIEDRGWKGGDFDPGVGWIRSPLTRSSLKLWDRCKLVRMIGKLESGATKTEDLPASTYTKKKEPDGHENLKLDQDRFLIFAQERFASEALVADRRTVAIVNASGTGGQARAMERILRTMGSGVVAIREGEKERGRCRVVYRGESGGLAGWLEERYGCTLVNDQNDNRQAEVEVYLGEEWVRL